MIQRSPRHRKKSLAGSRKSAFPGLQYPVNLTEQPRAFIDVMDAAQHEDVVELSLSQRKPRYVRLDEGCARAIACDRDPQHRFRDVSADAAREPSLDELERLAMPATQLGDRSQMLVLDNIEKHAVEIGHVLLSVRIAEIGDVFLLYLFVVPALDQGVVRKRALSEKRNPAVIDAIARISSDRTQDVALLRQAGAGDGAAQEIQDRNAAV